MSNVPSGQVAAFPMLSLDMQCVLAGLRSKTSLNRYESGKRGDRMLNSYSACEEDQVRGFTSSTYELLKLKTVRPKE